MKYQQVMRGFRNDDTLEQEFLLCQFEELPPYWEECILLDHETACAVTCRPLDERLEWFLEFEAI